MEELPGICDALSAAGPNYGLRDFGIYAMDSMRLDKGYRGWKTDIEAGYTPYERCVASVCREPLYDPENAHLRA